MSKMDHPDKRDASFFVFATYFKRQLYIEDEEKLKRIVK